VDLQGVSQQSVLDVSQLNQPSVLDVNQQNAQGVSQQSVNQLNALRNGYLSDHHQNYRHRYQSEIQSVRQNHNDHHRRLNDYRHHLSDRH
jgi:hypothetical protein